MVDLPEFGNGARFKPQGSSSSSEDVRAASEDRLLEARLEGRSGPKRSSVGGRRRMREEQRRREKEGNSRESPATRVSAQVVSILESILAPPVGDSAHGCNSFPALKRAPFCPRVTVAGVLRCPLMSFIHLNDFQNAKCPLKLFKGPKKVLFSYFSSNLT